MRVAMQGLSGSCKCDREVCKIALSIDIQLNVLIHMHF